VRTEAPIPDWQKEVEAMSTVTIEEAQSKLPELIDHLAAGEEVVITRNSLPVAKLVAPAPMSPQPLFGRGRGKVTVVSEDDEHLEDFEEYMP
jgi:prevent-host-death family protein